ncbi:MAG: Gfo/Idh/MocA family oxidoreductase [Candidatus Jorgensenbacteria bacterium]|nr:Gfo/Idh/MocA family oxidoreductase [Candidatus Jorgensenbacteria bacterium]
MRILTGNKWRGGFLDYFRNKSEYRIQVLAWKNLEKLENVYHTRPKSLRLLINYFPVVGFQGLFTKTWSRLREARRNEKYISCGIGMIIEAVEGGEFSKGDIVSFVAPWHPPLAERIVLPADLVFKIEKSETPELKVDSILYSTVTDSADKWWGVVKAWSVYSGIEISEGSNKVLANGIRSELKNTDWSKSQTIDASLPDSITDTHGELKDRKSGVKTGVLFGYGNYAKINIIPYSKPFVDIKSVHEIDPTQIVIEKQVQKWDSSPFPRKDEKADVFFVASYNHTHVPITLHALNQGSYVVVEKPVVMDYAELAELEKTLRRVGRKLFIGFHKRYGTFNKCALKDLGVKYGDPISYHSIVYELIQPEFFWYNWPVSRSTFLSNGCHQVDHFLHLNNWSKPINSDIKLLQDGAVEVWIELENGATFTTTFSEKGSLRVGPRDIVELKVHGKNIRITDAIKYMSEDNTRIIRKKRIFKTDSYREMYQEIGRKIAANEDGDTIESIIMTSKIMLDLEEKLKQMKGWEDKYDKAKVRFEKYVR